MTIDPSGTWEGYWIQSESQTRCSAMVDGSWYWGNSTLRFDENFSTLEWVRDYCGEGESQVYNGNRPLI